jgi:hypothetical protein
MALVNPAPTGRTGLFLPLLSDFLNLIAMG